MLALFVLLAMLALFIGSLVLLVRLVRVVFPGSQDGRRRPKAARVVSSSGERRKPVRIGGRPVTAAPQTSSAGARLASPELTATWRYRQFLQLGAEPVTAAGAAMAEVSANAMRSLVERGCPPDLALSILEPDDSR